MAVAQREEYKALLKAQRTLTQLLDTDPDKAPAIATALRGVIDQKRVMRMQPKPKDIDVVRNARTADRAPRGPVLIEVGEAEQPLHDTTQTSSATQASSVPGPVTLADTGAPSSPDLPTV